MVVIRSQIDFQAQERTGVSCDSARNQSLVWDVEERTYFVLHEFYAGGVLRLAWFYVRRTLFDFVGSILFNRRGLRET